MAKETPQSKKRKLAAYQTKLMGLLAHADTLDAKVVRNTKALISQMRETILARTAEISSQAGTMGQPSWGAYWMPRLTSAYNEVVINLAAQFGQDLSNYTIDAYKIGQQFADDGLKFAKPDIDLDNIPTIDPDLIKIASSFSADLITKMKQHQITAISKEIGLSIGLSEPPTKLMGRLAADISAGPWKTSYDRAEVIARTEIARVQELGRQFRAEQHYKEFPDLEAYEQYLGAEVGEWPCKKCEQYDGNVYDKHGQPFIIAKGKAEGEAPELPIHPRCRCFADDMEVRVLTAAGEDTWKNVLTLLEDDQCWALNPETLMPGWMGVKSVIIGRHSGKMIRFFGPTIEMITTPDHEMWVKHTGNKYDKYSEIRKGNDWQKLRADNVTVNHLHMHGHLRPTGCLGIEMIDYDGLVGCCELKDHGIMLVRRAGEEHKYKTTFAGNCTYVPWIPGLSPEPERGKSAEEAEDHKHKNAALVKWQDQIGGGGAWVVNVFQGDYKVSQLVVGAFKQSSREELIQAAINTVKNMGVDIEPGEMKIVGMSARFGPGKKDGKPAGKKTLGKKFKGIQEKPEGDDPVYESLPSDDADWVFVESAQDAKERFEKNFTKNKVGCWHWTGAKDKDGYGAFWYNGGSVRAIRFAWELYGGGSLKGDKRLLCHTCKDSKNCVRKSHLYLGTHQDNMDDRLGKNTYEPN